jgi:hypothetical protein
MPVLLALRFARPPVPRFTACVWIAAAVPPLNPLNLEPGPYDPALQVHVRPAKSQGLALADAQSQRDRPASTVPLGRSYLQDAASLPTGQRLDLLRGHRGSINQGGYIPRDPAAPHRNPQGAGKYPVNLQDRAGDRPPP